MKRWDIYYLGECIHASCEGETEFAAIAECARFSMLAGEHLKLDWLLAKPAAADEFTEVSEES